MADQLAVEAAIVDILRGASGTSATGKPVYLHGVLTYAPLALQATPYAEVYMVSDQRASGADLITDQYRFLIRVLNTVNDEAGASGQLKALVTPIKTLFDARRRLNGTCSISFLDLVEHNPDARLRGGNDTPLLYYDFYITATVKSAPAAQAD